MNILWVVVLAAMAFLLVARLRMRPKRRPPAEVYARRIDGFQVVARLSPDMPGGCLFDHGMQFGKGFRRKEGPTLPHAEGCACATVPFSFTSNEVFNGALRNFAGIRNPVEGLPQSSADKLVEAMKRAESAPLPPDAQSYLAAVVIEPQAPGVAAAITAFLEERFAYLKARQGEPVAALPPGDLAAEN